MARPGIQRLEAFGELIPSNHVPPIRRCIPFRQNTAWNIWVFLGFVAMFAIIGLNDSILNC